LKLKAKVKLIIKTDISIIKAKIRIERDISIRVTRGVKIRKDSIKVVIKVSIRAISIFSTDYIIKVKRDISIKAKIKK